MRPTPGRPCRIGATLFLLFALVPPAFADYEEGRQAYSQGRIAEAHDLWQQAARQGDARSLYELGKLYAEGLGVPQDFAKSYAYFNRAAALGLVDALEARKIMEQEMTPEERAQGRRLTASLFEGAPRTEKTAAGKIIVVGIVERFSWDDPEMEALRRDWLKDQVRVLAETLPSQEFAAYADAFDYGTEVWPFRRNLSLCESERAHRILSTSLVASAAGSGGGRTNWERTLQLTMFDCRTSEKTRKTYLHRHKQGWNLQPSYADFFERAQLPSSN